ncbi:MAG: prolipoprotein diacylglyceryl transferase [Blautia sp.]|nr:prolipoprotein diacylglyceryl transferase [Blautia sp.]
MRSVLFTIGPFSVYGYGFMLAVGVLAGYFCTTVRARKIGVDVEQAFGLVMWCLVFGFVCAKLLFFLTEWEYFLQDPVSCIIHFSDGFVIYGGIIGGIVGAALYCRRQKLSFLKMLDLALPSVALGQGFGRLGCFLAGCCYGRETEGPLAVVFHDSEFAPSGVPLVPTQIFSSILDFLHFFLLLSIARKKNRDGVVGAAYLLFYSAGRFILEFFRGDLERGSVGFFSTSQFIAIFTFLAGGLLLVFLRRGESREML